MAAELNDVRSKLVSQQVSLSQESKTRQEMEIKATSMEEEIFQLRKGLQHKNTEFDQYVKDLDYLRSQLSTTQAAADANAVLAQSAQLQCLVLLKELDEKNSILKEHENHVDWLVAQPDLLHKELQEREVSQKQQTGDVSMIKQENAQADAKARATKNLENGTIFEEFSPKSLEKISKSVISKDEQITKFREEHWRLKTKDSESQLERHLRTNQELKKRVLKLEFCLEEARSQIRKIQRMGERKDKALKELREQLVRQQKDGCTGHEKQKFWESTGFKILISVSMLILVVFAKR
ncbi:hypothetical protein AQUCO_02900059v1 [Aquilegia coerulea]|uniref:Uncharacterized protein n=1 Tax=Aquilegia coerulea TaxID=218851 RepID=A0A2G5D348_AQUCA|nr:hypothetical protein AQUCO_02900059v1 [Aquilegia coerulea]PIA37943.1 hypothetical protein AQUCO_02900059v1 [Aquilegia coerulea]